MKRFMLLACLTVIGLQGQAALSAKSYVDTGLVGHWDAVQNVAYDAAHETGASTWTDLSGNGLNIPVPTGASFSADALTTVRRYGSSSSGNWAGSKAYAAFKNADYTVEIAFNQIEPTPTWGAGGYQNCGMMLVLGSDDYWMGVYKNERIGFNGSFGNSYNFNSGVSVQVPETVGQHFMSCAQLGTDVRVVVDDAVVTATKTPKATPSTNRGLCFNRHGYSSYASNGVDCCYHSIRIYDHRLSDAEVAVNRAIDRVRYFGADASKIALPENCGWRFDTTDPTNVKLERQVVVSVKNGVGGLVSVNAGAATMRDDSVWVEKGMTVNVLLRAEAAQGYAFLGWDGIDDEDKKYELEVQAAVGADVTAVFRKTDGSEARSYGWVGADGAEWAVAANWADEDGLRGVPAENDDVTIPAGKRVVLGENLAHYASVTVAGTLVMTNWTTALVSDAVTISNGGVLTCGDPATTKEGLSRVWVQCVDLTVAVGGVIDVDKRGYCGGAIGAFRAGYGPGRSPSGYSVAASHGGYGGRTIDRVYSNILPTVLPYDNYEDPVEAGSGGGSSTWEAGGAGGGVIRVEATGVVTVNGTITACGASTVNYGKTSGSLQGNAGSGGTINIRCSRFSGSGTLVADGGGGCKPTDRAGMAGGGGMIAVRYDTEQQQSADVTGMRITAAGGLYYNRESPAYRSYNVTADEKRAEADIGTVWFSDSKILDALLGKGLTGQVRGLVEYSYEGDLAFEFGHVRFAEEGVAVSVAGDLILGGDDSRLEIGGCTATNRATFVSLYAGRTPASLTVSGDLRLGGVSRLDVHSAAVSGTSVFGAEVTVGGLFEIGGGCYVYSWSDNEDLSSPRFTVGQMKVAENAVFSADKRGGRGARGCASGLTTYARGAGPGAGYYDVAGGFGGAGGGSRSTYPEGGGFAYGEAESPCQAGSGGGAHGEYNEGGAGGGLVYVVADGGEIRVAGRLSADGDKDSYGPNKNGCGGSGGAIFLSCRKFVAEETAEFSAVGGDSQPAASVPAGAGGGGRIAVWCGEKYEAGIRNGRISSATMPLTPENVRPKHAREIGDFFACDENASFIADGGVTTGALADETLNGKDGSRFFGFIGAPQGLAIIVR